MIHLVKVELINLFISILCFTERNFHLIPAALFIFFMGLCMDFFPFYFILFYFLKSGVRYSYHRVLQGYILAFFTVLYVGVWCSAFICSFFFFLILHFSRIVSALLIFIHRLLVEVIN